MINDIFNGDSASEIRAKLNEMIKIVNDYSSSQYVGGGDPYSPPAGADSVNVWTQNMASPMPDSDSGTACSSIDMQYQHTVYIQKDPMNMAGTSVPESMDYLYEESALTMPLGMGYYGWYDMTYLQNKVIQIGDNGQILSINDCV